MARRPLSVADAYHASPLCSQIRGGARRMMASDGPRGQVLDRPGWRIVRELGPRGAERFDPPERSAQRSAVRVRVPEPWQPGGRGSRWARRSGRPWRPEGRAASGGATMARAAASPARAAASLSASSSVTSACTFPIAHPARPIPPAPESLEEGLLRPGEHEQGRRQHAARPAPRAIGASSFSAGGWPEPATIHTTSAHVSQCGEAKIPSATRTPSTTDAGVPAARLDLLR